LFHEAQTAARLLFAIAKSNSQVNGKLERREGKMPRNERHVEPSQDGGWDVRAPRGQRSSAHTETQEQAIDRAREIVRNSGGGEVVIHGRDGWIRDSDTVAPGNDPNPPKDTR
jgi:hypothetical protein